MKENSYDNNMSELDEEKVNYQELLFKYIIHWPWFVASVLACLIGAWVYLHFQTPVYRVSASIMIKDDKKSGGGGSVSDLENLGIGGMITSTQSIDNEIEVLRSKTILKEVVNNLELYITYYDEDEFPKKELYKASPIIVNLTAQEADNLPGVAMIDMKLTQEGGLDVNLKAGLNEYNKHFDKLPAVLPTDVGTFGFALKDSLSNGKIEGQNITRNISAIVSQPFGVAKGYQGALTIAPTSKATSVATVSLVNTNIQRGQDFINKLMEMYNRNTNNDKNEVAQKTREFINERIQIIDEELGNTEDKLEAFKRNAGLTDISSDAQLAVSGNAEYEKKRVENLLAAGAANQKQLDDWDAQVKLLERQLVAQESSLQNSTNSLIEQGNSVAIQVAQMEDQLAKCHVQSPIEGTVLAKYAEAGELAAIGKPLFKVAEVDRMYLRAYITSEQLSKVKLGDQVTVYADYGNSEQKAYPGVVTWISDRSEFTPKTILTKNERANLVYAVKIAVKNDGALKIGMYGGVTLKN